MGLFEDLYVECMEKESRSQPTVAWSSSIFIGLLYKILVGNHRKRNERERKWEGKWRRKDNEYWTCCPQSFLSVLLFSDSPSHSAAHIFKKYFCSFLPSSQGRIHISVQTQSLVRAHFLAPRNAGSSRGNWGLYVGWEGGDLRPQAVNQSQSIGFLAAWPSPAPSTPKSSTQMNTQAEGNLPSSQAVPGNWAHSEKLFWFFRKSSSKPNLPSQEQQKQQSLMCPGDEGSVRNSLPLPASQTHKKHPQLD